MSETAEASLRLIEVASEGSRQVFEFWLDATRQTQRAMLEMWGVSSGRTERPGGTTGAQSQSVPASGYCMKCKAQREIRNAGQVMLKNGRPAIEGTCPVCSTRMFKIGAKARTEPRSI